MLCYVVLHFVYFVTTTIMFQKCIVNFFALVASCVRTSLNIIVTCIEYSLVIKYRFFHESNTIYSLEQ